MDPEFVYHSIGRILKYQPRLIFGAPPSREDLDLRYRKLSIDGIRHYQKIYVTLMETKRIMGEIDGIRKTV